MKSLILILAVFMSFSTAMAQVQNTTQFCKDNTTLIQNTQVNFTINGIAQNISASSPVICQYGCSSNACNPDPFITDMEIIGGIFGFIFLIFLFLKGVNWI